MSNNRKVREPGTAIQLTGLTKAAPPLVALVLFGLAQVAHADTPPLPLSACTQMLDQSTLMIRQAQVYASGDAFELVSKKAKEATTLMEEAFRCTETADLSPGEELDDWRRAMEDWRVQHAVLGSMMKAKTPPTQ